MFNLTYKGMTASTVGHVPAQSYFVYAAPPDAGLHPPHDRLHDPVGTIVLTVAAMGCAAIGLRRDTSNDS